MALSGCYVPKQARVMDMFTNCPPIYKPVVTNATYITQIDLYKRHISGLLLFKTMNDSTSRVVFMNETGFKFFDFEFSPRSFRVQYIVPGLNKKFIVNTLRKDLGYLVVPPSENDARIQLKEENHTTLKFPRGKTNSYYTADNRCSAVAQIAEGTDSKKNLLIDLSGIRNHNPETINIAHHTFKLTIFLKQIDK
jgi:hypothetical protein